ncbi:glycerate 2-kinase [Phycisphaerales bacterium]|nr:glycerate 2-kinase [Phycisphaerales bacterium]
MIPSFGPGRGVWAAGAIAGVFCGIVIRPAPSYPAAEEHVKRVIASVLLAADPAAAVRDSWTTPKGEVKLLACGKAAVVMAGTAASLLGRAVRGVVTCPPERVEELRVPGVEVFPCDHPFPSPRNVEAALRARELVRGVAKDETLIAMISGGASAHLALPAEGLTLDDLREVTRRLQLAGAGIGELNAVRKHVEQLKGGRLAGVCRGEIEAYILSDVMGDRLDVIASGPTAPDPSTFAEALGVLESRGVAASVPRVVEHLRRGMAGKIPETPKAGEACFTRVTNRVIASNRRAVEAARDAAVSMGFHLAGVEHAVEGEAAVVGARLARRAAELADSRRPWAWVVGGEWTVTVGERGGKGGPGQELALAAAKGLHERGVLGAVLSFSTDGVDGPTDAAGAVVTGETWARATDAGLDPEAGLSRHDSYAVLEGCGALVRTGPTGTNLNHVAVLLVY